MAVFTSTSTAPGDLLPAVPRFEIGTFFVTIYHCAKRVSAGDEEQVKKASKKLLTCLGEGRDMFINQFHPSSPAGNVEGSAHAGTKEEVHGGGESGRLAHYHVELIGAQRDTAFSDGEMTIIKYKLQEFGWA